MQSMTIARSRDYTRVVDNVESKNRIVGCEEGERHEQRRSELVIANNQGPREREALFVGPVPARPNFASVDGRYGTGTGLPGPDHSDRALSDGVSIC